MIVWLKGKKKKQPYFLVMITDVQLPRFIQTNLSSLKEQMISRDIVMFHSPTFKVKEAEVYYVNSNSWPWD